MSNRVISYKNLPTRAPILLTVVVWLVTDRYQPDRLMLGVEISLLVIIWVAWFVMFFTQELVDVVGQEKKKED